MGIKSKLKKAIKLFARKEPVTIPLLQGDYLKNRTALITGATSGIGLAIAKGFIDNGCTVILTGRNEEKLQKCINNIKKAKPSAKCDYAILDISKTEKIKESLDMIIEKYPKLDILVNNAGVLVGDNIGNTNIDDYELVMKTNLEGVFFLSQAFANHMIKNDIKGNILNISSSSSKRPAISTYALAKWGISGLTLGMAKKYIKHGIVVNAVAPGPTATKMLGKEDTTDISNSAVPAGRFAMPQEIANIATILVSDMGKMIIGDTVYVTGGSGVITYDDMQY